MLFQTIMTLDELSIAISAISSSVSIYLELSADFSMFNHQLLILVRF